MVKRLVAQENPPTPECYLQTRARTMGSADQQPRLYALLHQHTKHALHSMHFEQCRGPCSACIPAVPNGKLSQQCPTAEYPCSAIVLSRRISTKYLIPCGAPNSAFRTSEHFSQPLSLRVFLPCPTQSLCACTARPQPGIIF